MRRRSPPRVSPDFAAAYLPSGSGRIDSVRQTARSGFFEQAIVYSNATASAGERADGARRRASEGVTFLRAPTRAPSLPKCARRYRASPCASAKHRVRTRRASTATRPDPLGASGSCLYAWQFAKRVSPLRETAMGRIRTGAYAAQVRLRYCHPTMPEARIRRADGRHAHEAGDARYVRHAAICRRQRLFAHAAARSRPQ